MINYLIPDIDIINEMYTFVAKGQSYEADDGHTDDYDVPCSFWLAD
jgi:hypothetical protein